LIRVQEIGKAYRSGRRQVEALDEVSCTVQQGETLAVVGKSGSGKTTLLNCIGGLERPDSGRIACLGENIHELSRRALSMFQREHLGFVFQFGNLLSYLTVHENIEFPLALNRVPRRERDLRVSALLEATARGRCPVNSRAAKCSVSRSPGRSRIGRRSCWPTSPPPASTRRRLTISCS
jgi:putative ABC transport system ATP-binding protein